MFKLVQVGLHSTGTTPPPEFFVKLVQYEARTIGKRAVGILLEYFIVSVEVLQAEEIG